MEKWSTLSGPLFRPGNIHPEEIAYLTWHKLEEKELLLLPVAVHPSVDRVLSNCCEYVHVPSEKDCAVKNSLLTC